MLYTIPYILHLLETSEILRSFEEGSSVVAILKWMTSEEHFAPLKA